MRIYNHLGFYFIHGIYIQGSALRMCTVIHRLPFFIISILSAYCAAGFISCSAAITIYPFVQAP